MDSEAIGVVRDLFAAIDAAVPRERASQTERARDLFELLGCDGGLVEAIDEPAFRRTRLDELGTWTDDPWKGATFGVDASTTRPLEYNNGLVVDTAYAKTAVAEGSDAVNVTDHHRAVERGGQIVSVAYFDDADSTLHSQSFGGDHIRGELLAFPTSAEETRNIQKSVTTVAQRLSESRQASYSLDIVDGPLFLDGAILPLGIIYWLLLDMVGERSPAGSWAVPEKIVQNYIDVIDTQYERNQPLLGIVKTSSMSQLLGGLRAKIEHHDLRDEEGRRRDVPWVRDHQFVGEVLRHDDLDYLTYTSWFVHEGIEIDGHVYELLAPVARQLKHGEPADYRRAFFYLRLPKSGDVLRVETPALFVRDGDRREAVQYKVLKEVAQRRDVPRAVKRADHLARITRENRETISDMLDRAEVSFDHNWDGRWSDIDEEPEK